MLKLLKSTHCQQGSAYIAALIAAGIMGVIMTGMTEAVNVALRGQRTVDVRLATNDFENEIYTFLSAQNVCTYNFGNDTTRVNEIVGVKVYNQLNSQDATGNNIVRYNTLPGAGGGDNLYEQGRLRLIGMELRQFEPAGTLAQPSRDAMATLRLSIERMGGMLGSKTVIRDINLGLQLKDFYPTVANPFLEFCRAVGGAGDQIWTQKPNKDIYYNGGNVGIGTDNPTTLLEIESSRDDKVLLRDTSVGGFNLQLQVGNDRGIIATDGHFSIHTGSNLAAGSPNGQRLTILSTGRIGINNPAPSAQLDVIGDIRSHTNVSSTNDESTVINLRLLKNLAYIEGGMCGMNGVWQDVPNQDRIIFCSLVMVDDDTILPDKTTLNYGGGSKCHIRKHLGRWQFYAPMPCSMVVCAYGCLALP